MAEFQHEAFSMKSVADEVLNHLKPLIGLKLSVTRRAADLRSLQFGPIGAADKGEAIAFALHIQCPWRIEGADGIITGRSDLWEPVEVGEDFDGKAWDYDSDGNLQDKRIGALFGDYDGKPARSFLNRTDDLVVEDVQADPCGGASIGFSGGYKLVLFPAGSQSEDWRILRPKTGEAHFVIRGGVVEEDG